MVKFLPVAKRESNLYFFEIFVDDWYFFVDDVLFGAWKCDKIVAYTYIIKSWNVIGRIYIGTKEVSLKAICL